jgi:hypothetical protein
MLNFFARPDNIDIRLIPKVGMTFSNVDEAYNFYSQYAYEVGFPLKKYREWKNCKWLNDAKENVISVRIDLVNYEHNHEFLEKDTEKGQLQCNKTHDREYMEFLSAMQESRIPQHCIMDFVTEMHGGPENVPITVQDMSNL